MLKPRAVGLLPVCLTMKPVGEPDALIGHVRFDERGWETERCRMAQATAPILDSTECDIARSRMDVRFRGKSGRAADITGTTEFDPACVKTHTIAKCRKYNSPTRYRTSCAQHDSTPWCAISSRCFYVRGGRWSFRTAKTHLGHRRPDLL